MDRLSFTDFQRKRKKEDRFKTIRRGLYRFGFYGALMLLFEVAFYTIMKVGKLIPGVNALFGFPWIIDPRLDLMRIWDVPLITLFGQVSLWMFFVGGSVGLFGLENAYRKLHDKPWYLRGIVYMFTIMVFDWTSGFLLRQITGYDIWINPPGPLTIFGNLGYTTWAVAPMWFIAGLLAENLIKLVERFEQMKYILYLNSIPDTLNDMKG